MMYKLGLEFFNGSITTLATDRFNAANTFTKRKLLSNRSQHTLTFNNSSWCCLGRQSSGTVCWCYPYCPAGQATPHPHSPRGRDINFRSHDSYSPHRRRRDRYVTVDHRVHSTHLFSRRKIQATGRGKTFIRRLESQLYFRRLDFVWNLIRYGRAHSPRNVWFLLSPIT